MSCVHVRAVALLKCGGQIADERSLQVDAREAQVSACRSSGVDSGGMLVISPLAARSRFNYAVAAIISPI